MEVSKITRLDWVLIKDNTIKDLLEKYVVRCQDMGQNSWTEIDFEDCFSPTREKAATDPTCEYSIKTYGVSIFPTQEEVNTLREFWTTRDLPMKSLFFTVWW